MHPNQESKVRKVIHDSEHPSSPALHEEVVPASMPRGQQDDRAKHTRGNDTPELPEPAYLRQGEGAGFHKPSTGDQVASMSDVYFLGKTAPKPQC